MDEATYQRWWALHLRVVRAEVLTAREQAVYEAGCHELEHEEPLGDLSLNIAQIPARVRALEAERAALLARCQQLDAEIASLETALRQRKQQASADGR
jgi:hypothetical protein